MCSKCSKCLTMKLHWKGRKRKREEEVPTATLAPADDDAVQAAAEEVAKNRIMQFARRANADGGTGDILKVSASLSSAPAMRTAMQAFGQGKAGNGLSVFSGAMASLGHASGARALTVERRNLCAAPASVSAPPCTELLAKNSSGNSLMADLHAARVARQGPPQAEDASDSTAAVEPAGFSLLTYNLWFQVGRMPPVE